MPVINTNVAATITSNALAKNERAMSQTMERLSTGQRINSAADDAAGLAISSKMTSQIRGLDQAVRNGNDAISMIQTQDGAMIEVTNMLQRMRELAVQAASGTNGSTDRDSLQTEFAALAAQINTIGNDTSWNGVNILDTTATTSNFQIGANAGQTVSHTFAQIESGAVGLQSIGAKSNSGGPTVYTDAGLDTGGNVSANTPYIVGENRPGGMGELFVPQTAGRIFSNDDSMGMFNMAPMIAAIGQATAALGSLNSGQIMSPVNNIDSTKSNTLNISNSVDVTPRVNRTLSRLEYPESTGTTGRNTNNSGLKSALEEAAAIKNNYLNTLRQLEDVVKHYGRLNDPLRS